MIIVYAGSQPDSDDRPKPRFPSQKEEEVATRVRGLLQDLGPSAVIGALAAGSDIIFAENAQAEGIEVHANLPFAKDVFARTSVQDAGSHWLARYRRISGEVTCIEGALTETDDVYMEHNSVLLDYAARIAETNDERVWCIVVRPTPNGEETPSVTDDMASKAAGRGMLVIDIDPLADRKKAFIAMPFGRKFDPGLRRYIDCDQAFQRVYRPLLEDLDLHWNRADLSTDSGIIHVGMIDDLANSDVVVADLTGLNFNVAYELGMRHTFAPRATLLVRSIFTGLRTPPIPFDVAMMRVQSFDRGLEMTDKQAEDAIVALRPALIEAASNNLQNDSPVHEWFTIAALSPPYTRRSAKSDNEELLARQLVQDALRSGNSALLLDAAQTLVSSAIHEDTRKELRIELAVSLLEESAYTQAISLLELSEPAQDSPMHRLWLQKSILAFRRRGERQGSPEQQYDDLERATQLLQRAMQDGYSDSETYGMWAGLIKRQLLGARLSPLAASGAFQQMTDLYEAGFKTDPHPYTGVNFVMAVRLLGHVRTLTDVETAKAREAITVSKFLNNMVIAQGAPDAWALLTAAELDLHLALLDAQDTEPAALRYATAAQAASVEVVKSALDQLHFMKAFGDPEGVINPILSMLYEVKDLSR